MKQSTARKLYRTGAVVLIAAIAASGTFAWRDLSQKKVNEFAGGNNPDVVLVEDFEETDNWNIQNPVVNKDVSVKNTGDTELYVRVNFSEYLETKCSSYVTYPEGSDKAGQEVLFALDSDGNYIETTADDPNGYAANGKYYLVAQGANGEIDAMDATNRNGQIGKHMIDDSVVVQTAGAVRNDSTTYPTHKSYQRADGTEDSFYAWTNDITWQMPNAITMDEWLAGGSQYGAFWVLDSDGWAYWAEPLRSGEQTALLLDSATMEHMVVGDMFYAIGSQLDAISIDETTAWDGDMTDNAKALRDGLLKQAVSLTVAPADATMEVGETLQLTATVYPEQSVTWSSSNPEQVSVDANGLVTALAGTGDTPAVVTAAAGGMTASCAVTVEQPYAIGDTVEFGTHVNDDWEGEPISWWVYDVESDGTLTLLAKTAVGPDVCYHEKKQVADWETSYVRAYLNGDFYETMFTEEERAKIQPTTLLTAIADTDQFEETEDKVFLLATGGNYPEQSYMVTDLKAKDAEYGTAMTNYQMDGKYSWSRTPGYSYPKQSALALTATCGQGQQSVTSNFQVRPMIRVKL